MTCLTGYPNFSDLYSKPENKSENNENNIGKLNLEGLISFVNEIEPLIFEAYIFPKKIHENDFKT